MTAMPFFSVIIPTRNRVELFTDALQSALSQDFDDFEVLVSDNSTDNKTQLAIKPLLDNAKLTAFQTDGSLSMPEHWEFITQKARGRYVLVLTDRSILKQQALRTIYAAINSSVDEVLVCAWRWSVFDDNAGFEYASSPVIKQDAIVSLFAQDIAQNFIDRHESCHYDLPRALNSCYRHDIATTIRKRHGALFLPITPDYTSAFLLLAHTEKILFLDTALFMSQGLSVSNGGQAVDSIAAAEGYLKTLGISDYYAHVPIKMPLVDNIIFEDFLAIRELAGGELSKVHFNWVEYFVRCYKEILLKKSNTNQGKKDVVMLKQAWQQAFEAIADDEQHKVKSRLHSLRLFKLKIMIKRLPFSGYLISLYHALKKIS